jgi:Holliday junction resolvase
VTFYIMIMSHNICRSTKHIGAYEEKIIQTLTRYFQLEGYEAIPHSSLNIAWGRVLSDVDLLLIRNQMLTYIEVKSSRDNVRRARQQIERMIDYVDYAYVATDRQIKNWDMPKVGLIHVQEDKVAILRSAEKFLNKPKFYSTATLKKKCLARFFGKNNHYLVFVNKYDLAQYVYAKGKCTRTILKEIVTCGELCGSCCPIEERED